MERKISEMEEELKVKFISFAYAIIKLVWIRINKKKRHEKLTQNLFTTIER